MSIISSTATTTDLAITPAEKLGLMLFALLVVTLYFVPTIVALARHVPGTGSITVLNVLLGWSLWWWAIALSRAFGPTTVSAGQVPGSPAPAGWYPGPLQADARFLRYFDGQRWTGDVVARGCIVSVSDDVPGGQSCAVSAAVRSCPVAVM